MQNKDISNITGKFLIASPYAMEGNVFHKSVIYVLQHSAEGSAGLICNQQVRSSPVSNLFKHSNQKIYNSQICLDVYVGGPMDSERGFFLHSGEYNKNLLFKADNEELAVSSNFEILQDILAGKGPEKSLFIVGYTSWNAGQMEFELSRNLWIVSEPDPELVFLEKPENRWNMALRKLGLNNSEFIPVMANC